MKLAVQFEELAMFLFSIFLFCWTSYGWWVYPLFILAPDLSMIGYLLNSKTGAICYNIFHHKGLALLTLGSGIVFNSNELCLAGIILFGHSSIDRALGFGLKYPDSFHHTHLGFIGKK